MSDSAALSFADANFVTDWLLVGGDLRTQEPTLARRQLNELVAFGVTHILDVRDEWTDEAFVRGESQVNYLHHGMDDAGQRVPAVWFEEAVTWASDAITNGGVVFAHCHMGVNRGPSVALGILLDAGRDPIDAMSAIRSARPIAHMAYASDALRWHHDATGADIERRASDRRRMKVWRRENGLDVAKVIRGKRAAGY